MRKAFLIFLLPLICCCSHLAKVDLDETDELLLFVRNDQTTRQEIVLSGSDRAFLLFQMRSLLNPCPDQAILTVLLLALGGCIAVPVPEHGRDLKGKDTIESVRIGKTTREEILLNFGVPARCAVNDQVFSYEWRAMRSYAVQFHPASPVLVAGGGAGRYR